MDYYILYKSASRSNHDGDNSDEPYSYRGTTRGSHQIADYITTDPRPPNAWYARCHGQEWETERETTYCDLEEDKDYYLVYAVYSTGDSFGHDYDGSIEFVMLYDNIQDAETCERAVDGSDKRNSFTYSIEVPTGKTIKMHAPWNGYFESLSYVEIQPVRVRSGLW